MKTVFILFLVFWHNDTIRVEWVEMPTLSSCEIGLTAARTAKSSMGSYKSGSVVNGFCVEVPK